VRAFDLAIAGGTVVGGGQTYPATVAIAGGRIAEILAPQDAVSAARVIDARGLHVLPGLLDSHVHTRHPGGEAREDFQSGTAAAAAGGVTTLIEMPISKTPTNSRTHLLARVAAMAPQAHVDFALYGGAGHENLDDIAGQAEAGAVAFKTFLQPPPDHRRDEFHGLWCTDESRLGEVMTAVRRTGLRHWFHCEQAAMYAALQARLESLGHQRGRAHAESRPAVVEEVSAAIVLALAVDRRVPVGIVHCSSARSATLAADARLRGVDALVEACIPHLFFTSEALDRLGPYARCNPPLRSAGERRELWHAVADGLVNHLGTDHSPFQAADKEAGAHNIFLAPPGVCGLEVFAPLMLTAVARGDLSLARMAALTAERTASAFRLPSKGRIRTGFDADIALVDTRAAWVYDSARAVTRSAANMKLYDGFALKGRVVATLVRGVPVFEDGALVGPPGHGRFLRPDDAR
jgi:dihydropyrimidinase/allantoinase